MARSFTIQRLVHFHETDAAQQVHFSNFFKFMEEVEHAFFRSIGIALIMDYEGKKISWPRVASAFEYKSPVFAGDEITLNLELDRLGEKSISSICTVIRGDGPVAIGKSTAVCCELIPGKGLTSLPIPGFVRERILAALGERS